MSARARTNGTVEPGTGLRHDHRFGVVCAACFVKFYAAAITEKRGSVPVPEERP